MPPYWRLHLIPAQVTWSSTVRYAANYEQTGRSVEILILEGNWRTAADPSEISEIISALALDVTLKLCRRHCRRGISRRYRAHLQPRWCDVAR
jgi:hypothetical protein